MGSVNSYSIETGDGVILIDGQRELSSARAALDHLNPHAKPIAAIFLTHPHPDHFGGIGVFVEAAPDAPFYASQATRDSMAADSLGLIAASHEVVGDDSPRRSACPVRSCTTDRA